MAKKKRKRKLSPFRLKLKALGFKSYRAYLYSDYWKQFKERYYSKREKKCHVCGITTNISLHHLNYDHMGSERLKDVVPLCDKHHKKVHRMVKKGEPLAEAHKTLKKRFKKPKK